MSSGTGVQRVGAMASLVAALLCAALVPSAAFRSGPLAHQWRPAACLDLKARQTAGCIPPLRCPLLATAMSETSTDVGDVDQREWEQWTAKFAGKFVLRSGTATGTSRRAAIQTSGFMLCHPVIAARASPALSSGLVHRGARALICLCLVSVCGRVWRRIGRCLPRYCAAGRWTMPHSCRGVQDQ